VGNALLFAAVAFRISILLILFATLSNAEAQKVAAPGSQKIYQGIYFDEPVTGKDPTERDVTANDVVRFEKELETKAAWVYFSNNWSESRRFPISTCDWIKRLGKIPYVRLMLRSDLEQGHAESLFTLRNILQKKFDTDLQLWARDAKAFGAPMLIEWGTEPNGEWFSWNGKWNGGAKEGPLRFVEAYRHIVDVMRNEGATNLTWVWHVNWFDQPESAWNHFEKYYPGSDYCDWVGLSVYGPLTPRARDGTESFRSKMDQAYPRLVKVAAGKPVIVSEFGCDIHHGKVDARDWARKALDDLFARRWPEVIGFCWWNEWWENDDNKRHNTDMIILHDPGLTKVFREELAKHAGAIQEASVMLEP
jgi:hypothetical protein